MSALHKFKVGQSVLFAPSRWSMRSKSDRCRVVRLLPASSGELLYRVQCEAEPFGRNARESELSSS